MADSEPGTEGSSVFSCEVRIRLTDDGEWGDSCRANLILAEGQLTLNAGCEKFRFYRFGGGKFRQRVIVGWLSMTLGRPIPIRTDDLKWLKDENASVCGLQISIPSPVSESLLIEAREPGQMVGIEKAVRQLWEGL